MKINHDLQLLYVKCYTCKQCFLTKQRHQEHHDYDVINVPAFIQKHQDSKENGLKHLQKNRFILK